VVDNVIVYRDVYRGSFSATPRKQWRSSKGTMWFCKQIIVAVGSLPPSFFLTKFLKVL
jgi:hypothetical protein